ncbi:autophagy- protein 2 [Phlyctochytrium planicorne]|nr:autophagy- protein 2 [Phlyctochytrium planicorne]
MLNFIPQSFQKKVLLFLVRKALGQFLEDDLDVENLDVQLTNGRVVLRDLKINVTVVNELLEKAGVPFLVLRGRVGEICVVVPWNNIWFGDCTLEVRGIKIDAVANKPQKVESLDAASELLASSVHFAGDFLRNQQFQSDPSTAAEFPFLTEENDGVKTIASLMERIISGASLLLEDMNIRVSVKDEIGVSSTSLNIRIASLAIREPESKEVSSDNSNETREAKPSLEKLLYLTGMTLSLADYCATPGNGSAPLFEQSFQPSPEKADTPQFTTISNSILNAPSDIIIRVTFPTASASQSTASASGLYKTATESMLGSTSVFDSPKVDVRVIFETASVVISPSDVSTLLAFANSFQSQDLETSLSDSTTSEDDDKASTRGARVVVDFETLDLFFLEQERMGKGRISPSILSGLTSGSNDILEQNVPMHLRCCIDRSSVLLNTGPVGTSTKLSFSSLSVLLWAPAPPSSITQIGRYIPFVALDGPRPFHSSDPVFSYFIRNVTPPLPADIGKHSIIILTSSQTGDVEAAVDLESAFVMVDFGKGKILVDFLERMKASLAVPLEKGTVASPVEPVKKAVGLEVSVSVKHVVAVVFSPGDSVWERMPNRSILVVDVSKLAIISSSSDDSFGSGKVSRSISVGFESLNLSIIGPIVSNPVKKRGGNGVIKSTIISLLNPASSLPSKDDYCFRYRIDSEQPYEDAIMMDEATEDDANSGFGYQSWYDLGEGKGKPEMEVAPAEDVTDKVFEVKLNSIDVEMSKANFDALLVFADQVTAGLGGEVIGSSVKALSPRQTKAPELGEPSLLQVLTFHASIQRVNVLLQSSSGTSYSYQAALANIAIDATIQTNKPNYSFRCSCADLRIEDTLNKIIFIYSEATTGPFPLLILKSPETLLANGKKTSSFSIAVKGLIVRFPVDIARVGEDLGGFFRMPSEIVYAEDVDRITKLSLVLETCRVGLLTSGAEFAGFLDVGGDLVTGGAGTEVKILIARAGLKLLDLRREGVREIGDGEEWDSYWENSVTVATMDTVELQLRTQSGGIVDIEISDRMVTLETCADSFQSLNEFVGALGNLGQGGKQSSPKPEKELKSSLHGVETSGHVNLEALGEIFDADDQVLSSPIHSPPPISMQEMYDRDDCILIGSENEGGEKVVGDVIFAYDPVDTFCIVEDHFALTRKMKSRALVKEAPRFRFRTTGFDISWKLYEGFDWVRDDGGGGTAGKQSVGPSKAREREPIGGSESDFEHISDGGDGDTGFTDAAQDRMEGDEYNDINSQGGRANDPAMEFRAFHVSIDVSVFSPGSERASKIVLLVRDFEIIDHVRTSTWRKFLSHMRADSSDQPREKRSDMIRVEVLKVRPNPAQNIEETRLKVQLSIMIQLCEIRPISVKIDYKPKQVDYTNLKDGHFIEILNFFHLDGAEMTLRDIRLTGIRGWSRLFESLMYEWLPHIRNTQVPRVVSGVSGVKAFVNLGVGIANLILIPIEQYKKDGRIVKGIQKGMKSFVKVATMETLRLGTRLAVGTQVLLEHADEIFSDEASREDGQVTSKLSEQPRDFREGVEMGLYSMKKSIGTAARTILAVPMEVYEKTGTQGTAKAVIRAVPVAVLKPMIGATEAVSKTLMGLQNSIDPNKRLQMEDKTFSLAAAATGVATYFYVQTPKHALAPPLLNRPNGVHCDASDSKTSDWTNNRLGEYENKLRSFSHPLKVFNYFASKAKDGKKYMTVYDFMRSLVPTRLYHEGAIQNRVPSAEKFFALADTDGDGLISFSEYLVFVTLLGTPMEHWRVAFKIFDEDGNGTVSRNEFEKIMSLHLESVRVGSRLGSKEKEQNVNLPASGLLRLLFGDKGKQPLTYDAFADFMGKLQLEMLKLEFNQFDVKNDTISLRDFGKAVVSYGNQKTLGSLLSRIDSFPETNERITFEQYMQFDRTIRSKIEDIGENCGLAYQYYPTVLKSHWTRKEFQNIMRRVVGLHLTDGQIEILFHLFDKNSDGRLDESEFYDHVCKGRVSRGLNPRDSKPFSFQRVYDCIKENI